MGKKWEDLEGGHRVAPEKPDFLTGLGLLNSEGHGGMAMRTLQSRLMELVKSVEYQKDFKKLKNSILLLREPKRHIKGPYPIGFTSPIKFLRVEPIQPQDTAVRWGIIPLKELQGLLKKGNINDHRIEIPDAYSDFKVRNRLRYLFDPAKPYPKFNPFDDKPIVCQLTPDSWTRIPMTVDINYPARILERTFKLLIKGLKEAYKFKEERIERYSDNDIYRAKDLDQQGLSVTDIFRIWFPQHKDFRFTRDYEIGGKTVEVLDAVAKLEWIKRLIQRSRERRL